MASDSNEKSRMPRLSDTSTVSTSSTSSIASNESCSSSTCCSTQNIRVVTRIRPLSTKEVNENSKESVIALENAKMIQVAKNKDFAFDAVFGPNTTQKEVYEQTAGDMIRSNLFKGFNVTVLAYGQTGSGKTHTIFGGNGNMVTNTLNEDLDGIIPRAVHDVFGYMNQITCGAERVKVQLSYLEIYNEEARDLLSEDPSPPDLQIRDSGGDVVVQNLSLHNVTSPMEVASLMESAADKRSTAATLMNAVSSRSHAICTLHVRIAPLPDQADAEEEITAKLTLVDLAGSERAKKTGAQGTRLKEGININKGLFVLGQVVSSLAELGQQTGSSDSSSIYVKYRDSKLTRLLQDSLGGNSKTVMVACASPADTNIDETVNTLRYAERTRSIKNSAVRNVVATPLSPAEAAALKRENQMLKLQLFQAQAKISSMSSLPAMDVANNHASFNAAAIHTRTHCNPLSATQGIVDNELNGLSLKDLDIVTKLKIHCSSLEEKAHQLEEKCKATSEDCLDASLRADKWQMRCESLAKILHDNKIEVPKTSQEGDVDETSNIVNELRKEIMELKNRLQDTVVDAEVSRSIAAAVVSRNGDVDTAETMAMIISSDTHHVEDDKDDAESEMAAEVLSAELAAMSGSIEHKEEMIKQIQKERELMEAMKSHFEGAIQSLQDEVGTLSSERDGLMTRLERESAGKDGDNDDIQTRRLRERTKSLFCQIKELKQKSAEHTRSLRLHTHAKNKCQKLEAELSADKKRRAELQRRLKKESAERRNEQKKARFDAAKMLRDSQRLKLELNKVKDAAAKQENVLRRKAAEAMHRQKLLAERTKKRARGTGSIASDLSSQRKEEVNCFIEREVCNSLSLQKLRDDIEDNSLLLEETEERRELMKSQQTSNEDSSVLRSLDAEIELRSKIIEQLEKNTKEIFKSVNRNPHPAEKHSSKFIEMSFWQSLSKLEVKYVSQIFFAKLIEQQYECDSLKCSKKSDITNQVAKALEKVRRSNEKELMQLKVQHSVDISGLLQSTKETVQRDVAHKIATTVSTDNVSLDNDTKSSIDNMLNEYFSSYNTIGEKVKSDIEGIKANQDGMKRLVDDMADNMISQNEAKAMLAAQKKKDKKKSKEARYLEPEDIFKSDDEAEVVEDGDDSDWSPDTPMPNKKKLCPSLDESEPIKSPASNANSAVEVDQEQYYVKMTVVELRALLRKNGLTVSGKKSELIKRLQIYGNTKGKDVLTASAKKRTRSRSAPRTASKKMRVLSPRLPAKKSPKVAPPSISRNKSSVRGLASSTKASMLRRRTPSDSETAHLITKRSSRPVVSTSSASISSDSLSLARTTHRKSPSKPVVSATSASVSSGSLTSAKQTRNGKLASSARTSNGSASSSENSTRSSRRRALTSSSSSSTSSKSTVSSIAGSKQSSETTDNSISRTSRSVASSASAKSGKKNGSPLGTRKQRSGALSNLTNSAKKRRTTRRQDIAKDVNAKLKELERLQSVL